MPCIKVLSQQENMSHKHTYIYIYPGAIVTILFSSCRLCSMEWLFLIIVSADLVFPLMNLILCSLLLCYRNMSLLKPFNIPQIASLCKQEYYLLYLFTLKTQHFSFPNCSVLVLAASLGGCNAPDSTADSGRRWPTFWPALVVLSGERPFLLWLLWETPSLLHARLPAGRFPCHGYLRSIALPFWAEIWGLQRSWSS